MNFRWFISRTVRHASDMRGHVQKLLNAQRDILAPPAVTALEESLAAMRVVLASEGIPADIAKKFVDTFGVSSICNILGAIKTAKAIKAGKGQNVVTVATDGFDRYPSVMERLNQTAGKMTKDEAKRRLDIFRKTPLDEWAQEGTKFHRQRWHNQKYYTWVEQQGKAIAAAGHKARAIRAKCERPNRE